MASAANDVRQHLVSFTECPICMETFVDPRFLPCAHSFCLKCIRAISLGKLAGKSLTCPLCRKEFVLPQDGLSSLPKSYFIQQLKDLADMPRPPEFCARCRTDVKGRPTTVARQVVMFCTVCQQGLCEVCVGLHGRVRSLSKHELVEVCDAERSRTEVDVDFKVEDMALAAHCDEHQDRVLELYCLDCKMAMCVTCLVTSHKTHQFSDVNGVADEFQQQMTEDIKDVEKSIATRRELMTRLKEDRDEFTRRVNDVDNELTGHVNRLKLLVDEEELRLRNELETCKEDRLKRIDDVTEEVERSVLFAEGPVKRAEGLMSRGTAVAIARHVNRFHELASALKKVDFKQEVDDLGSLSVSFKPNDVMITTRKAMLRLGTLDIISGSTSVAATGLLGDPLSGPPRAAPGNTSPLTQHGGPSGGPPGAAPGNISTLTQHGGPSGGPPRAAPGNISTLTQHGGPSGGPPGAAPGNISTLTPITSTQTIPVSSGRVVGVTSVNNHLYVLRSLSRKEIIVYDTLTLTLKETLPVSGLSEDTTYSALESCTTNDCLYISDSFKNTVFKLVLSTKTVTSWPVVNRPNGLSVNGACQVLVTCYNSNIIKEYSTSGQLIRIIQLQSTVISSPVHVVQLTNGHFVVSHHGPLSGGVSIVDEQGRLVTSYRNELQRHSDNSKLMLPRYLAVDRRGRVFVADGCNNRIVILDSNSSLSKVNELSVLTTSGGALRDPRCVHINELSGRLYVGEYIGGRVVSFNVVF